jgi:O-antigen/teichoic acid export membrane protein
MFHRWLVIALAVGLCLLLTIIICNESITRHLLGKNYWSGRSLMPLIGIGYLFLIVSYSFNAYLYAHKNTKIILKLGVVGATLSIVLALSMAHIWGLMGVASACALTYGVLMLMTGVVVSLRMRLKLNLSAKKVLS